MQTVYVQREGWGADDKLPRLGHLVAPEKRTEVFVHHTVTLDSDSTPNEWETWTEIAAKMRFLQTCRPDLGLDVPYTAVAFCTPDRLVVCEGRGLYRTGAHTPDHNTSALGVAFAGDFEAKPAPANLDWRLIELGQWLGGLRDFGFPALGTSRPSPDRIAWGHREQRATACPGKLLWERLPLIQF